MEKITIDQIGIEAHKRYATDQALLDLSYITESQMISPHLEIAATSQIYSSQWEELFGIHLNNIPWAAFSPPPKYNAQRKRFFAQTLIPSIFFSDEKEDDDESFKNFMHALACRKIKKDESALLGLIESIKLLNSLLKEVNARKLRYQKG